MGKKTRRKQVGIPKQNAAGRKTSFACIQDNFCPLHVKYVNGHLSCTVWVEKANRIDVGAVMQRKCIEWDLDPDQCRTQLLPLHHQMSAEDLTAENNGQPPVLFIQLSVEPSISTKLAEEKGKVLALEEGKNIVDKQVQPKDLSKEIVELWNLFLKAQEEISQQGEKILQVQEEILQQKEKILQVQEEIVDVSTRLDKIDFLNSWGMSYI